MAAVLTTASLVQCQHGAPAQLITSDTRLSAGGAAVLLESDVLTVSGCPFFEGPNYSPCLTIEWESGADSLTVGGVAVLTEDSIGTCMSAEGVDQGLALVSVGAVELDAT